MGGDREEKGQPSVLPHKVKSLNLVRGWEAVPKWTSVQWEDNSRPGVCCTHVTRSPPSYGHRPGVEKTSQRKSVTQTLGPAEPPEAARGGTPSVSTAPSSLGDNHTCAGGSILRNVGRVRGDITQDLSRSKAT